MLAHARNADASEEMQRFLFSKKTQWELQQHSDGPCSVWPPSHDPYMPFLFRHKHLLMAT